MPTTMRESVVQLGALDQWQLELSLGARTRTMFDTVMRAACREAEARDLDRCGCKHAARAAIREAAAIILGANGPEVSPKSARRNRTGN